jgi:hydrogenase maturation protease
MARLLIGYGNPGRGDDGLGPALAEAVEALGLKGVDVKVGFQLNVEDAFDLQGYEAVYFVDAAVQGPEPYDYRRIQPEDPAQFSSHAVSPEGVLALAEALFGLRVPGYVMAVRGYSFDDFGAPLSSRAAANLEAATARLLQVLDSPAPRSSLGSAPASSSA